MQKTLVLITASLDDIKAEKKKCIFVRIKCTTPCIVCVCVGTGENKMTRSKVEDPLICVNAQQRLLYPLTYKYMHTCTHTGSSFATGRKTEQLECTSWFIQNLDISRVPQCSKLQHCHFTARRADVWIHGLAWDLSVCGCMFSLCVPSLTKDMHVSLIGDCKLLIGVNLCLSVYVSTVIEWWSIQGEPCLSPKHIRDRLQQPFRGQEDKSIHGRGNVRKPRLCVLPGFIFKFQFESKRILYRLS